MSTVRASILRNLLSTSDKMVNLKTLKSIAFLEDMEIHRRSGYFSSEKQFEDKYTAADDTGGFSMPPENWPSRSPQTSHLEVQ